MILWIKEGLSPFLLLRRPLLYFHFHFISFFILDLPKLHTISFNGEYALAGDQPTIPACGAPFRPWKLPDMGAENLGPHSPLVLITLPSVYSRTCYTMINGYYSFGNKLIMKSKLK